MSAEASGQKSEAGGQPATGRVESRGNPAT